MISRSTARIVFVGGTAAALVAAAAACSTQLVVDKDKVAKEVTNQVAKEKGRAPESVTCPDDLKGEVGATLRCDLKDGAKTYGVTVTVTKVEGNDVKFKFKVDDDPK